MTYQRNTEQVKAFKLALVKAFFVMAKQIASQGVPQTLPEALRAYAAEVEAREALAAKVAADAPKSVGSMMAPRPRVPSGDIPLQDYCHPQEGAGCAPEMATLPIAEGETWGGQRDQRRGTTPGSARGSDYR